MINITPDQFLTSQYEKLGGFLPFLRKYLLQLINMGYPEAPLEQEAIKMAEKICGEWSFPLKYRDRSENGTGAVDWKQKAYGKENKNIWGLTFAQFIE